MLMGKLLQVVSMIDSNLKYCREELEMTQTELGYIFGVSKEPFLIGRMVIM